MSIYKNMTIEEGAAHVMHQLTNEDIDYVISNGNGFSDLHDICDANMLLPLVDDIGFDANNNDLCEFLNAIMEEVTEIILNIPNERK